MIIQASAADTAPGTPVADGGSIYQVRVVKFLAGATIAFEQPNSKRTIYGQHTYKTRRPGGFTRIYLTGTVTIEYTTEILESIDPLIVGPSDVGQAAPSQAVLVGGQDGGGILRALVLKLANAFAPATDYVAGVSDVGGVSNPAIYDVTSAPNAGLDSGIVDMTPWRQLIFFMITSAGTSVVTAQWTDDAGAAVNNMIQTAVAASAYGAWGAGVAPVANSSLGLPLPRRVRLFAGAAGVGNTVRLRIEGRR
jgi:hypothetical protein